MEFKLTHCTPAEKTLQRANQKERNPKAFVALGWHLGTNQIKVVKKIWIEMRGLHSHQQVV